MFISCAFDGAQKRARRRKFFDTTVPRIGDENTSVAVHRNRSRRIKLSFTSSLATFEHAGGWSGRGIQVWSSWEHFYALLKFTNVPVREIKDVKTPVSSTE